MNSFSGISDEFSSTKRVLRTLQAMQSKLTALEQEKREPIAIIGMGCRFPGGANTPEAFWHLLEQGVDAITEVPVNRWNIDDFYDPSPEAPGKMSTRWGGFLEKVDAFDANFFGITPREAVSMDPQQRLLLEVTWEALEDAGQVIPRLAGSSTGVFIGICGSDYSQGRSSDLALLDGYTATGNAHSIAANRLSYLLDLQGPSIAIDTACSSSLVSVHLACQSLRTSDCRLALAGGVNLMLSPLSNIALSKAYMLAPDGRCKTFDAQANGFVRAEGCGIVVLKRLSDALADRDRILALICGSAVNQDGRTNGLMAPNGRSQQVVIRQALQNAGVAPSQVGYIEAHGTGTYLGDPIEVEALTEVYGSPRQDEQICMIGSVKTNIGHLEAASGVAGLIKAVLCLQHGIIPPILHFHRLNPNISLEHTPFCIPTSCCSWPENGSSRFAGVSSFGFGGTNSHLILGEYKLQMTQEKDELGATDQCYLLPLSAQTSESLRSLIQAYEAFLATANTISIKDICYTAGLRRTHYKHRSAVVGHSCTELSNDLKALLQGEIHPELGLQTGKQKMVFVFSGQGSQWWGMGRQLLEQESLFREVVEKCDALHRQYAGWSILQELLTDESHCQFDKTEIAQPVLFALQIALATLWRSWNIVPDAVVGHSIGEVAAAYIAQALSLDDAVRIVFHRSRLMQLATGQGKMANIEMSLEDAEQELIKYKGRLSIAASNSPISTVLSGEPASLEEVAEVLKRKGISWRYLNVNYAFHSPQMDPLRNELVQALQGLETQAALLTLYSTVTGKPYDGQMLDADYWGRNMREPVLFVNAIDGLVKEGYNTFLEISPHPILSSAISQCLDTSNQKSIILPSMRRGQEDKAVMLNSLGMLYTAGYPIAWDRLYPDDAQCVHLPTYPWQRERYWLDIEIGKTKTSPWKTAQSKQKEWKHPLLGEHKKSAHGAGTQFWEIELNGDLLSYLEDHRIHDAVILPGAAYIEMALAGAKIVFGKEQGMLTDIKVETALFLQKDSPRVVQLVFSPEEKDEVSFYVYSRPATTTQKSEAWTLHAQGNILSHANNHVRNTSRMLEQFVLVEAKKRCVEEMSGQEYYLKLQAEGLDYGASFRGITRLWRGNNEALGEILVPDALKGEVESYLFHPAVLDACLQVLPAAIPVGTGNNLHGAYVLVSIDQVTMYKKPALHLWSYASFLPGENHFSGFLKGDIFLINDAEQVVAEIKGICLRSLEQENIQNDADNANINNWFYEVYWQPEERSQQKLTSQQPLVTSQGKWLIFADRDQVGQLLSTILEEHGESCILVYPGEVYETLRPGCYQLNPAKPQDFQHLLKDAFQDTQTSCRGIVHLWSIEETIAEDVLPSSLLAGQIRGCGSVLHLVQALVHTGWSTPPRIWLVTRGVQPVAQTAPLAISQSTLWGLGRTIAHEHPALWGGLVDLDAQGSAQEAARLLQEEIQAFQGEDQLVFRNGVRYAARLVRKPAFQLPQTLPSRLRSNGTYLITGGMGDLGLTVASWMVKRGARHLILMGHTKLPERSVWNGLEKGSRLAQRIKSIREIENQGVQVHLAQIDVADEEQVRDFLTVFSSEGWPPIRGVIHAAGLLHDKTLLQINIDTLLAVLHPKVEGSWVIHRLLKNEALDFFVLFSSIASLLGSPGQANYTAANAFLDALAHYRRAQGLAALSINWGTWSEIGMAARLVQDVHFKHRGLKDIAPSQGLKILERLLEQDMQDTAQIGVFPLDWYLLREYYPLGEEPPFISSLLHEETDKLSREENPEGAARLTRDALLACEPEKRRQMLETYLRKQIARAVGTAEANVDIYLSLIELGSDSLIAIEMKNRIEIDLGVTLSVVSFLEGLNIAQLAQKILTQLEASYARSISFTPSQDHQHQSLPSYEQRALWFLHHLTPDSAAYNFSFALQITPEIDIPRLQHAFQILTQRHLLLRTTFIEHDGELVQCVHEQAKVGFYQEDVSTWSEAQIQKRLIEEAHRPFNLEQGPLVRVGLYMKSTDLPILQLSVHHIISDFQSCIQILAELQVIFAAETYTQKTFLPPLEKEYKDYVSWQAKLPKSAEGERHLAYWKKQFARKLSVLDLPTDRDRPPIALFQGSSYAFHIDERLSQQLKVLAKAEGVTLYVILLAAFQVFLYHSTNQKDILVGSPLANRKRQEFEGVVGSFTNLLALRADLSANPPFQEFLHQMHHTVLDALEHQDYPFPLLVEQLQLSRGSGYSPIIQVLFALQKAHPFKGQRIANSALAEVGVQMNIEDLTWEAIALPQHTAQFDLALTIADVDGELPASLQYRTDLFDATSIERFVQHFKILLQNIVDQPETRLSDLPLLTHLEFLGHADHQIKMRSVRIEPGKVENAPESEHEKPFIAPHNPIEEILVALWRETLKVEKVEIYDNFFALGGHSLLVMQLLSRIERALKVKIPLHAFFEASNIAELAQVLVRYEIEPGRTAAVARLRLQLQSLPEEQKQQLLQAPQQNKNVQRESNKDL